MSGSELSGPLGLYVRPSSYLSCGLSCPLIRGILDL